MDKETREWIYDNSKYRSENIYKLLDEIKKCVNIMSQDNKDISNEYIKLRDEYNTNDEIKLLKEEIEHIRKNSIQILTDKEYDLFRHFRDKHYEKCKNGSRIDISLTYTGIGSAITIKCPICGEELDITDMDRW